MSEASMMEQKNKTLETMVNQVPEQLQHENDLAHQNMIAGQYTVLEKSDMLKSGSYKTGKKTQQKSGHKNSPEMVLILEEADALEMLISSLSFDTSDAEAFMSISDTLIDRMKRLVEKCDAYLEKKTPKSSFGKARYRMVTEMADTLERDIIGLQDKSQAFLDLPAEEKARINTWEEFLNWERVEILRNGENDVKISKSGGNTSDVLIVEKGGKKTFFKHEEALSTLDIKRIYADHKKKFLNGRKPKDFRNDPAEYFANKFFSEFYIHCIEMYEMKPYAQSFLKHSSSGDGFEDLKDFTKKLNEISNYRNLNHVISDIESIESETERNAVKKRVGDIFIAMCKEALSSDLAERIAKISPGETLAKRNVAASRVAKLLGISSVLPKSEMVAIEADGKKQYGVLMAEAKGIPFYKFYYQEAGEEYRNKKLIYSPDAMRDLMNLQILDSLCGQTDRHIANIMADVEIREIDGEQRVVIKKITGIDSDLSFGKITYSALNAGQKLINLKRIEDLDGLAFPAMSKEVAESLLALTPEMLDYEMIGLISKAERQALLDRLLGIQEAIQRQKDYEANHPGVPTKFLEKNQWADYQKDLTKKLIGNKQFKDKLKKDTYLTPTAVVGIKID